MSDLAVIAIEEIKSRSVQGVTKPFLCTGDDGKQYYVKGLPGCGRYELIAEYLAGSLGVSMGLPVPPLQIVDVPAELVSLNTVEGIGELGSGLAFGSECVSFTQEYSNSIRPLIDPNLQARVLLFDWWIKNEDRKYGPNGGNCEITVRNAFPSGCGMAVNILFFILFGTNCLCKNTTS